MAVDFFLVEGGTFLGTGKGAEFPFGTVMPALLSAGFDDIPLYELLRR